MRVEQDVMPAPRFKLNGRIATLRYTNRRGKVTVQSGRRNWLVNGVVVDQLLTGCNGPFEVRLTPTGPWHLLTFTIDEVVQSLSTNPSGRRRLARLARRHDYVGPSVLSA